MLRVNIHAGPLAAVSRFNRTDWVDIGYERLAALADYKVVLFNVDVGATPPVFLRNYPRWSASLWDLVARAIARALDGTAELAHDVAPPLETSARRYAFADALSAIIEHAPAGGSSGRRLGALEIVRHRRARGVYRARVEEDLQPARSTLPFEFRPRVLRPAELVLRAALLRLWGQLATLPPRPALFLPPARMVDGKPYVSIRRLPEPARTGFLRWLQRCSEPPLGAPGAPDGLAPETMYTLFLREAV